MIFSSECRQVGRPLKVRMMFLVYLLLYTVVSVPSLTCLLSWHYTGSPTKCWRQPANEILLLLRDVWLFALALSLIFLALGYAVNVGLDYWDFIHELTPVTEAFVRNLVFEINSLIFVIPMAGLGGWLSWWRWRFLRVHFGLERGSHFLHEV